MVLWLRIYDVVDTLDDMSLGVQLFEQPFRIKFRTPEAVLPYFEKRLSLPPMVGEHGMLDNEFERLMLLMLSEGKTLDEIAQICDADSGFVQEVSKDMAGGRLIRKVDGVFQPVVSVITSDYAADGRELADKASDQLAALLTDNLSGRRRLMDSLAQAVQKAVPPTTYHREYPQHHRYAATTPSDRNCQGSQVLDRQLIWRTVRE